MSDLIRYYLTLLTVAISKRINKKNVVVLYHFENLSEKDLLKEMHLKYLLKRIILFLRKLEYHSIFINVGAYIGEYSRELAEISYLTCPIEAHPNNYKILCNNMANLKASKVIPINYAISNFNGYCYLYI
jgi:hypothetical protein